MPATVDRASAARAGRSPLFHSAVHSRVTAGRRAAREQLPRRWRPRADDDVLRVGELEIRPHEGLAARRRPRRCTLSVREFGLLVALARRAGRDRPARGRSTRWSGAATLRAGDRSIDVYVHKLRVEARGRRCRSGASSTPTWASATASSPEPSHAFSHRGDTRGNRLRPVRCDGTASRHEMQVHTNSSPLSPSPAPWPSASPRAATTTSRAAASAAPSERPREARRARSRIDGSSTVYPFAQAAAEQFQRGEARRQRSRSASPAPAAASRSSAPARPTSPTPRGRSRTTRRSRSARRTASTYERGPGRQRRHRRRHQPGARRSTA